MIKFLTFLSKFKELIEILKLMQANQNIMSGIVSLFDPTNDTNLKNEQTIPEEWVWEL